MLMCAGFAKNARDALGERKLPWDCPELAAGELLLCGI
jgi:hypothetical protein